MIAMRTPPASLPTSRETVANPSTAGSRACYRIFLQHVATGAKGPLYDAFEARSDGEPGIRLVSHSTIPMLDTARVCLARGQVGYLEFWRPGAKSPCMTVGIEEAAKLTVIDSAQQGPKFGPWKPFDPQRAGIAIAAHPSELGAASA